MIHLDFGEFCQQLKQLKWHLNNVQLNVHLWMTPLFCALSVLLNSCSGYEEATCDLEPYLSCRKT